MNAELTPRDHVYLLAGSQHDWHTLRGTTSQLQSGFAEGADDRGRPQRWLTCPDCLANDAFTREQRIGCERCGGRGEIPDPGPDPMRNRTAGLQAFYGHDNQERRDRAGAIDAQIVRLRLTALQREGLEDPEDWLTRTLRLKQAHDRTGDYLLLEHAQDRLGWANPSLHFVWMRVVADGLPASRDTRHRLDRVADELAAWMLGAIAATRLAQWLEQARLGVPGRHRRLRPDTILVPAGLAEQRHHPGKGRWANPHAQGQRNALVVAMDAEGRTAGEIAAKTGITKRRVRQILAEVRVEATATGPAA